MEIPTPVLGSRDSGSGTRAAWVPVDACTLPTVEQPLRAAEFDELFATSLRDVERLDPQRARLVVSGDQDLPGRVQRLVDAESSCCSFFAFTVTPQARSCAESETESVELTIEVPAARAEVLAALLDRAEASR